MGAEELEQAGLRSCGMHRQASEAAVGLQVITKVDCRLHGMGV
jgi:hypothetical protein